MKTKGLTVWEKHAEKIVLARVYVAAGALTAMQFIGEPNAVGDIAPSEIDGLLQDRAEALLAKLRDEAPAGVELPYPKLGFDDLLAQRDLSLSPGSELPTFQIAMAPSVVGVGLGKNLELPVPQIRAPNQVAVGQYADALVEGVVDQFPELQELFTPGEPHDLIFATVRARFDLAHLRQEFRGKEGQADGGIIPSSWYNDRPEHLVDVVVEREELHDEQWTDLRTINPIPGQTSVREKLTGELYASLRDEVLTDLADPGYQFGVIQPPFYPTKSADWAIPQWNEIDAADDNETRIKRLKQNLRQFYAEYDRLVEELEDAGGSMDKGDDRGRGRDRGGDRGGGGGTGRGGSGGKRDAPGRGAGGFGGAGDDQQGKRGDRDDSPAKDKERLQKQLKRDIKRINRKIMNTEADLRELGVDPDAEEILNDPFAAIDGDDILVWGHDLTVEPGKTYRYRISVNVYNPFFGKKRSLVEAQQVHADVFTLNSEPSDWSTPVRIHSLRRVFITNANTKGGKHGLGRATAEVYRFYDGIQWLEQFYVQPGAAIGGVEKVQHNGEIIEIDFTTSFFVMDIVEEIEEGRNERGAPDLVRGSARVLLRDLDDPRIVEMRDPRIEERDPERLRLQDKLPVVTADRGSG